MFLALVVGDLPVLVDREGEFLRHGLVVGIAGFLGLDNDGPCLALGAVVDEHVESYEDNPDYNAPLKVLLGKEKDKEEYQQYGHRCEVIVSGVEYLKNFNHFDPLLFCLLSSLLLGNELGYTKGNNFSVDFASGTETLLRERDAVGGKRAHEGSVRVAGDGTDIDETLLAEGKLESLFGGVVFSDHRVVLGGFDGSAAALVEDDRAAAIDGEHRDAGGVTAGDKFPGAFLFGGGLAREDDSGTFLSHGIGAGDNLEPYGVHGTLEIQEVAGTVGHEPEGSRLDGLAGSHCNALTFLVDFDIRIRILVELEFLGYFFVESDEAADVHFDCDFFHIHLVLLFVALEIK